MIISSLFVLGLARSTRGSTFLGTVAAIIYLFMPAMLVVSSRFSLQQDIPFMLFLTASIYFGAKIVRAIQPSSISLVLFAISVSLMALTREIGLVMGTAIFFILLAMKFNSGKLLPRLVFICLSLSPLYVLTIYDVYASGISYTILTRSVTLIGATCVLVFLGGYTRDRKPLSTVIKLRFLFPFIIPMIVITLNFVSFMGPYPIMIFSAEHSETLQVYRAVFNTPDDLDWSASEAVLKMPRIDVLFTAIALGPAFILFKVHGLTKIIRELKTNTIYPLVLSMLTLMLVVWSYLLDSRFEGANIRHVIYFAPILSILIIACMRTETSYHRLYQIGVIVFVIFYTLNNSLYTAQYDDGFGGFILDPKYGPLVGPFDVWVSVALIVPPMILKGAKMHPRIQSPVIRTRIYTIVLVLLLAFQAYTVSSSSIASASVDSPDTPPYSGWELYVFDVVNYLNRADEGNVLGVRAPAIPFFTGRVSYDFYNPHTITQMTSLLSSQNSTVFKNGLSEKNIRYIVVPNERSPLYQSTINLQNISKILDYAKSDSDFIRLAFTNYDVYKYVDHYAVNLIDQNHVWGTFNYAKLIATTDNMTIFVSPEKVTKIYNRGILTTDLKLEERPLIMAIDYVSRSYVGDASYALEIRSADGENILWGRALVNTQGESVREVFMVPSEVFSDPIEFRIYIVTEGLGHHQIVMKQLAIAYA
jgi:hypothetical protein